MADVPTEAGWYWWRRTDTAAHRCRCRWRVLQVFGGHQCTPKDSPAWLVVVGEAPFPTVGKIGGEWGLRIPEPPVLAAMEATARAASALTTTAQRAELDHLLAALRELWLVCPVMLLSRRGEQGA